MTSTFLPIRVWIAAICAATSLVAWTACRVTSEYRFASDTAFFAIAPVQPWSAAGEEKPIVTLVPGVSLPEPPRAAAVVAAEDAGAALLELLVQAVSTAPAPRPAAPNRKPLRGKWEGW